MPHHLLPQRLLHFRSYYIGGGQLSEERCQDQRLPVVFVADYTNDLSVTQIECFGPIGSVEIWIVTMFPNNGLELHRLWADVS